MNVLDWLLVGVVAIYALSGYWQGFVTGAFATIGLLAGGLFGVWVAPQALGEVEPSLWVSLGALFIVIMAASLGQALLQMVGARIRDRISWQPVRAVDAVGGSALSAAAVLLVAWALGVAVAGSPLGGLTPMVRSSVVLAKVDGVLPGQANLVLKTFNNVVGSSFFPRYLEPFAPERIVSVEPGDERMLADPDVVRASQSIVKVVGATGCGSVSEGTGFFYAPGRLMTNAHVVAGITRPEVRIDGGGSLTGSVVVYDSDLDVAVIAVDSTVPHLLFDRAAKATDSVAVAGYPLNGPYHVGAGRIRSQQRMRSPDIYGVGTVLREVFAVRGLVRPGNSGGPVLTSKGEVAGVVFAASVTDSETGYALTADQVAESAAQGVVSDKPVDTGACVN